MKTDGLREFAETIESKVRVGLALSFLILILIFNFFDFNPQIKTFFALALFFYIPFELGEFFLIYSNQNLEDKLKSGVSYILINYIFGIIIVYASTLLFMNLPNFRYSYLLLIFYTIILIKNLYKIKDFVVFSKKRTFFELKMSEHKVYLISLFLLTCMSVTYILIDLPLPNCLKDTMYAVITAIILPLFISEPPLFYYSVSTK